MPGRLRWYFRHAVNISAANLPISCDGAGSVVRTLVSANRSVFASAVTTAKTVNDKVSQWQTIRPDRRHSVRRYNENFQCVRDAWTMRDCIGDTNRCNGRDNGGGCSCGGACRWNGASKNRTADANYTWRYIFEKNVIHIYEHICTHSVLL